MILPQYRLNVALLTGAGLLVLAACSPAATPYEPPTAADATDTAELETAATTASAEEAVIPAAGEDEAEAADPSLDAEEGHAHEPHVHGGGDLAVTMEDDFLTLTLDAPMANFGLSESAALKDEDAEEYATGLAEPMGPTTCVETERSANTRTNGEHGAMTVSVVWRCKKIERVEGMRVNLFETYPAFHHVDAIYLGPNGEQVAKELTPTDTEIDFD